MITAKARQINGRITGIPNVGLDKWGVNGAEPDFLLLHRLCYFIFKSLQEGCKQHRVGIHVLLVTYEEYTEAGMGRSYH